MVAKVGQVTIDMGFNVARFEKDINSISRKLGNMGRSFQNAGRSLTTGLTLPIVAAGAAVVKMGSDFESAMTKSLAIMGDVSDSMRNDMEQAALDVATTTTFSANQAAESYFYLASAGLDAAQSIDALATVAQFAQAGAFDMALATDLLTDAQSALGLSVDDAAMNMENMVRVSDVLVKANTLANATVQQFSESLTNKAGAALRVLGKDVEEGVAVLAAFADQGVKGAEAGTQLSIVLRDMQKAAQNNADVFQQYGIAVYDASGEMRNIADIVSDLENALAGMSDEQKKATLAQLGFQEKSVQAQLTLLGTSDAIREYERELKNAAGITDEVANKQLESLGSVFQLIQSRVEATAITFYDSLRPIIVDTIVPALDTLLSSLEGAVNWFNELPGPVQKTILGLTAFLAAIGPLTWAIGGTLTGLSSLIKLMPMMAKGITSVVAAMGPWGIALAAISAAIIYFQDDIANATIKVGEFLGVIEELPEIVGKISEAYNRVAGEIGITAGKLDEFTKINKDALRIFGLHKKEIEGWRKELDSGKISQEQFETRLESLVRSLEAVKTETGEWEYVIGETRRKVEEIVAPINNAATAVSTLTTAELEAKIEAERLRQEFITAAPNISAYEANIEDLVQDISDLQGKTNLAKLETGYFGGVLSVLDAGLKTSKQQFEENQGAIDAFIKSKYGIKPAAEDAQGALSNFSTNVSTVFTNLAQNLGKSILNIFEDPAGTLKNMAKNLAEGLLSAFMESFVTPLVENLAAKLTDKLTGVLDFIPGIGGSGGGIIPQGPGLPGTGGIGGVAGGAGSAAGGIVGGVIGAAGGIVGGIISGAMSRGGDLLNQAHITNEWLKGIYIKVFQLQDILWINVARVDEVKGSVESMKWMLHARLVEIRDALGGVESYQTGTSYVPKTGLYKLHQAEAVIPPGGGGMGTVHIHFHGHVLTGNDFDKTIHDAMKRIFPRASMRLLTT